MLENHDSEVAENLTVLMGMEIEVLKQSHGWSGENIFFDMDEIYGVAEISRPVEISKVPNHEYWDDFDQSKNVRYICYNIIKKCKRRLGRRQYSLAKRLFYIGRRHNDLTQLSMAKWFCV